MDTSEAILTLMEFTGIADADTARQYLEQAGGDANAAAALYFDSLGRGDSSAPPAAPDDNLRAPDPQYTQALLSPPSTLTGMSGASVGYPRQNPTALAVESSAGTVAFRGLFELPDGLSSQETFARARELCRLQKKWLLVNIQQVDAFESLRLNRDVWKAEVVMDLIKDFFVFWQRTNISEEGQVFCDLYRVTALPYVCVIDPLTGRCLKTWSTRVLSDPIAVQSEFFEFIEQRQAAEQAKATRAQPSRETPGVSAPPAEPPAVSEHPPVSLQTNGSENAEEDGSCEPQAKEVLLGSSSSLQPSDYSDVNTQLLELRKLREQRRQQQNKTPQSG